ncbi:hypothetical protein SALBM311S_04267 [Streptomyces alboniger]
MTSGLPTVDGRRVRPGVLFRSGHLAHATAEDAAFLASLGLHTIFDFRNAADQKLEGPDVELPGVRNVNLPLTDPAHGSEFWTMVRDGRIDELRETLGDGRAADRMINSTAPSSRSEPPNTPWSCAHSPRTVSPRSCTVRPARTARVCPWR